MGRQLLPIIAMLAMATSWAGCDEGITPQPRDGDGGHLLDGVEAPVVDVVTLDTPRDGAPFGLAVVVDYEYGAEYALECAAYYGLKLRVGEQDLSARLTEAIEFGDYWIAPDGDLLALYVDDVVLAEGEYDAMAAFYGKAAYAHVGGAEIRVAPAEPLLTVDRLFSHYEGELAVDLQTPNPGDEMRAVIGGLDSSIVDSVLVELLDGSFEDDDAPVHVLIAKIDPYAPIPDLHASISFCPPHWLEPGLKHLRFTVNGQRTPWVQLDLTHDVKVRQLATELLFEKAGAYLEGFNVVAPYRTVPPGAQLVNGLSGETVHVVERTTQWLFFAFDPTAQFEQPDALWFLVDAELGDVEMFEGQAAWPDVVDDQGTRLMANFGTTGMLFNRAFAANVVPGQQLIHGETEEVPEIPSEELTGNGHSFVGVCKEEECPDGIRKIGVVLQMDDMNGFDHISEQMKSTYRHLGFDEIHHLNTDHFHDEWHDAQGRASLRAFRLLMERLVASVGEDCCAEIVVTILSHGSRGGMTNLRYKQPKTDGQGRVVGETTVKRKVANVDLLQLIDNALFFAGKQCIPVRVIIHTCYSGSTEEPAEDYMDDLYGDQPEDRPNIGIITSSGKSQVSGGSYTDGGSDVDIYFILALQICTTLDENGHVVYEGNSYDVDTNGDGYVNLEEAWECIRAVTDDLSQKKAGRRQNPQRWP